MIHPKRSELVALHYDELEGERREVVAAHVAECDACRRLSAELSSIESALSLGPDEAPPADGLERVLARVGDVQPARERREYGLRAIVPSLVAVVGGVTMVVQGGVTGAITFFFVGALVTFALAPVLILESQRRAS